MQSTLTVLVPAIGWALLHFIWQGLLIGWGASLLLFMLRGARPQLRYALACGAMLLCAAVPLAGVLAYIADAETGVKGGVVAAALPAALPSALPSVLPTLHADASAPAAGGAAGQLAALAAALHRQLPWIVGLWLAGAALMSLRLVMGLQWVAQRTAPVHFTVNHYWQRRLSELARRFDIDVHVRLGVSTRLDSPITAGVWQPIVLVPAALVTGMPPELLEALLAHELAHIKRRDYLVNLIQSTIEIVLFYHPSVWALSRRIRVEREQIADDLAVQVLGQPKRLAQALSELDRFQFATTQLAHAAHGGNLMSRIKRLLRPDVEPVSWKLALPLLGLCAAGAVFYANAAPQPSKQSVVTSAAPVAPPAQPAPPAPPAPPAAPAPAAPSTPSAPVAPPARPAPPAPQHLHVHGKDARTAYALVQADHAQGITMNGSRSDVGRIEQLRASVKGDFLWYRDGDQAWLIRDPAILAKASQAWAPVNRLGEQMDAQGKLMDEQGKVMDALGRQMDAVGRAAGKDFERDAKVQEREINALARRQESYARAAERIAQRMEREGVSDAQRDAYQREAERLHEQMAPLQKRIDELTRALAERGANIAASHAPMIDIGRQMDEASKPMAELGRRMGELGDAQAKASRAAEATMRSLIEEALKNGKAVPAPAGGSGKG